MTYGKVYKKIFPLKYFAESAKLGVMGGKKARKHTDFPPNLAFW